MARNYCLREIILLFSGRQSSKRVPENTSCSVNSVL